MRGARLLLAVMVALAASGCMRHDPDAGAGRGLFAAPLGAQSYAQTQPAMQPPTVLQYRAQTPATASYASAPPTGDQPYTLGPGDKLRVVVFGQDGISNTYIVDAGGNVSLPLIGSVPARGITTLQLSQRIAERLKQGYVREPHVTVEVESYRPFFILGEVTTPGQYPYVADMTVEKAIAIAGGFAPRAYKSTVELTRSAPGDQSKSEVPLNYPLRPGDTVLVKERWF
jgi:polysaccharide export outer membrane protein